MSEPFLGEIRMMSFNFPPRGWALCNGQVLPINQNQALFSLLGTTYGGNGQTTFGLPDLQGSAPLHAGNGHTLGERGGEQSHTLSITELPMHTHILSASSSDASSGSPTGNVFGRALGNVYAAGQDLTSMNAEAVANVGGGQAHENMQPYLTISFCIALQGIYPSRN